MAFHSPNLLSPHMITGPDCHFIHQRIFHCKRGILELGENIFQVGKKLYMFLPAAACGVLLGVIIWVSFMFCLRWTRDVIFIWLKCYCSTLSCPFILRLYGRFKQHLWGEKRKEVEDLELKSPIDKDLATSSWPSATSSTKVHATTFDKKKVSDFNQSVVQLVHQRRDFNLGEEHQGASVSTTGPSSFQSSPKSISSGIGVSEKENYSDKEEEEEEGDAVKYGNPVNEGGPIWG